MVALWFLCDFLLALMATAALFSAEVHPYLALVPVALFGLVEIPARRRRKLGPYAGCVSRLIFQVAGSLVGRRSPGTAPDPIQGEEQT